MKKQIWFAGVSGDCQSCFGGGKMLREVNYCELTASGTFLTLEIPSKFKQINPRNWIKIITSTKDIFFGKQAPNRLKNWSIQCFFGWQFNEVIFFYIKSLLTFLTFYIKSLTTLQLLQCYATTIEGLYCIVDYSMDDINLGSALLGPTSLEEDYEIDWLIK